MIKKRSELQAMSNEELESYEQSLLALWTQELRLKIKLIDLVQSTKGQLEIFNKLKSPDALENSRLKSSVYSLKEKS